MKIVPALNLVLSMILSLSFLTACVTKPSEPEQTSEALAPPPLGHTAAEPVIDYAGLKQKLGLEGAPQELGYKEAVFNTCKVGFGYPPDKDCQRLTYVVIRLRLQCRDSEDEASMGLIASDMPPLANKPVRWALAGSTGQDQTDESGYTEVDTILAKSARQERLKVAVGGQFLHVRASEMTRIVVPHIWCEQ